MISLKPLEEFDKSKAEEEYFRLRREIDTTGRLRDEDFAETLNGAKCFCFMLDNGDIFGYIYRRGSSVRDKQNQLVYGCAPSHQGKGKTTQGVAEYLKYLRTRGILECVAEVHLGDDENDRTSSIHILLKNGFDYCHTKGKDDVFKIKLN